MNPFRETLISRDGREVTVHTPGEASDLIHGHGYSKKPAPVHEAKLAELAAIDFPELLKAPKPTYLTK